MLFRTDVFQHRLTLAQGLFAQVCQKSVIWLRCHFAQVSFDTDIISHRCHFELVSFGRCNAAQVSFDTGASGTGVCHLAEIYIGAG